MSEPVQPIRGKVARILNSRELALNVGAQDGVKVGMCFDVLDPKGENIRDPDTDEVLGSVPRPKVRVRIIDVQQRLSIATTYRGRKVNVGGGGSSISHISRMLLPPKWVTEFETLKTDEKTWEDITEGDSYVKTGDPAVQVFGEEDSNTEQLARSQNPSS